ncbi:thioredoxin family protein [Acidiluteibacter ferrifornacis]|uniref:Thioredoxin n=1 Tax=Acidiluteibacter ferrifornacis TaxID=2692424 RepID=A0A6N9NKQ6_9FLAO|nr:thioredoxin family protein [Acidiluteibacter ferrifornacis]NBG66503.1 thioredoxin [Acidiluteibacter ferrifornacis]
MAVEKITDQSWEENVSNKENVIVKYYADWCGSCKLFAPKFKRLSNDEKYASVSFLEVNAEENEVARAAAGVDNLPFFAIFKNGKLVEGTATSKEEVVVSLIEKL